MNGFGCSARFVILRFMPVPADILLRMKGRLARPYARAAVFRRGPAVRRGGFTLLEIMLAMSILVILVAGLAGITTASLRLGRGVLEAQQDDSVRDGFERLLRENLAEIPQDAPLLLQQGGVNGGVQSVILGKAAGLFPVSGLPLVTESVALETRRDRSGRLSLWLVYYAGDLPKALQDNAVESDLLVQIPFKDGIEFLQWKVYDPTTDEWLDEWEETGRRPHFLEMVYRFAGDGFDHRMVFWMPKLQTRTGGGVGPGQGGPGVPGQSGQPGVGNPGGPLNPGGPGGFGPGQGGPGIRVEVPR